MPFLYKRLLSESVEYVIVLAFGRLSLLEACTLLSAEAPEPKFLCESAAIITKSNYQTIGRLAGIHKAAALFPSFTVSDDEPEVELFGREFENFVDITDERFSFCLSLYCHLGSEDLYQQLVQTIVTGIRARGFRKANLIRPDRGHEVQVKDVLSKHLFDFVAVPQGGRYRVGVTIYANDPEEMRKREFDRPERSPEITLSARLARLLVNLAGLRQGECLLDPFCGSGMILSEALLQGLACIGVESDQSRMATARKNLDWARKLSSRSGSYNLKNGDARQLESILENKVDAVVTEPILVRKLTSTPRLGEAERMIEDASKVYSEALYSMSAVTKRKGRIVVVVPSIKTTSGKEVSLLLEDTEAAGLAEFQPRRDVHFRFPVRVSGQSTRWISRSVYVFEKT